MTVEIISEADTAYRQGVADERARCMALCEGLALAYQMGGYGQPPATRDSICTAARWLRDEIAKGKTEYKTD